MKRSAAIVTTALAAMTFTQGQELSVFETRFSVKTSEIRDVGAKLHLFDSSGRCIIKYSAKVVYRVPVTKSYTLVMAYDGSTTDRTVESEWYGDVKIGHEATGYGRMWSSADKRKAFVLTKTLVDNGYMTNRNANARIGTRGQHRYEDFEFQTANGNTEDSQLFIQCSGLANFDANGNQTGGTGTFTGRGMTPIPHSKLPGAEQGMYNIDNALYWVEDVNDFYEDLHKATAIINGTYNPDYDIWGYWDFDENSKPVFIWGYNDTHFHGTYTTRRLTTVPIEKKKTTVHEIGTADFPKLRTYVNERVPLRQRNTDAWNYVP